MKRRTRRRMVLDFVTKSKGELARTIGNMRLWTGVHRKNYKNH